MAIARSKLGRFVLPRLYATDEGRSRGLRADGLVRPDTPDDVSLAAFVAAIREDAAMPEDTLECNSPEERVRAFSILSQATKDAKGQCPSLIALPRR